MLKQLLCILLIVLTASITLAYEPSISQYDEMAIREANWIKSLQKPDGAILDTPSPNANGEYKITPYFANQAATALTTDHNDLGLVKNYMNWYFTHLNWPDKYGYYGTIYDYYVTKNGGEISTDDYDSADSYAATFLSLVRAYFEAGGDVQFIRAHKYQINVIGNVIIKLLDNNNLTKAKPNQEMQFLMDNCEVFKGLTDAAFLFNNVFGDSRDAEWYQIYAGNVKNSIIKNLGDGDEFYVYIDGTFKKQPEWSIWYPDSIAQLYPIVYGVIPPTDSRAQNIYHNLNQSHTYWTKLEMGSDYPWAIVGYAAVLMGDTIRAKTYYNAVLMKYIRKGSPFPWYSAEAGWFIQMNRHMKFDW
jgi:hypothetical protein